MAGALEELIDEVRLLFHALVRSGDRLHAADAVPTGQRAVLEFLARNGPATVPDIARRRRVTRQHIQALVNPLVERGLVEPRPNPAHRRSPLMCLTPDGERTFRRMQQREARVLGRVEGLVGDARLKRAAATLRSVRGALEE